MAIVLALHSSDNHVFLKHFYIRNQNCVIAYPQSSFMGSK